MGAFFWIWILLGAMAICYGVVVACWGFFTYIAIFWQHFRIRKEHPAQLKSFNVTDLLFAIENEICFSLMKTTPLLLGLSVPWILYVGVSNTTVILAYYVVQVLCLLCVYRDILKLQEYDRQLVNSGLLRSYAGLPRWLLAYCYERSDNGI